MYDWNGNGKYDMQDNYMDYHSANSGSSGSSGPSSDWWVWPLLAIIVGVCPMLIPFVILGIFIFGR